MSILFKKLVGRGAQSLAVQVAKVWDLSGDKQRHHFKTNHILVTTAESPTKALERILEGEWAQITSIEFPTKGHIPYLRKSSGGPENQGMFELKFKHPVTIDTDYGFEWGGFNYHIRLDNLVGGLKKLKDLVEQADSKKIIVDFTANKSKSHPYFVQRFIDTYIKYGTTEFAQYIPTLEDSWPKVMDWYQNEFKEKLPLPKHVYRGVNVTNFVEHTRVQEALKLLKLKPEDIKTGNTILYPHWTQTFPISTSTSRHIAEDFAGGRLGSSTETTEALSLVMQFTLDPKDVVLDCRAFKTAHGGQSEIVLRPDKDYKVKLVRASYYKEGDK